MLERDVGKETIKEGQKEDLSAGEGKKKEGQKEDLSAGEGKKAEGQKEEDLSADLGKIHRSAGCPLNIVFFPNF